MSETVICFYARNGSGHTACGRPLGDWMPTWDTPDWEVTCPACLSTWAAPSAPPEAPKPSPVPVMAKPGHDFGDPYAAVVERTDGGKIITRVCKHCGLAPGWAGPACNPSSIDWRRTDEISNRSLTDSLPRAPEPRPITGPPQPMSSGYGAISHSYRHNVPRRTP